MILYRSSRGVLSSINELTVVLRVRPDLDVARRVSFEAFRAGALDAAIALAFGEAALADVHRDPPVPAGFSEQEMNAIVAGVRAGAEVVVGGSRCHQTYRGRDGELFIEDFDEGHTDERALAEESLRDVVESEPGAFLSILREPLAKRLAGALLANAPDARECFGELLLYGDAGDLAREDLLEAALAWPDRRPAPEALAKLQTNTDGNDVYHSIMSAIGYGENSVAAGHAGLLVISRLFEMTGGLRKLRRYRASFHVMAGDHAAALADLEWERAHMAKDDPDFEYLERDIAKLSST